ncbi:hypothetical protein ACT453_51715, partial [Bacillus sp. D-CC]
ADGTHGTKGFVTDVIDHYGIDFDILYSCGPLAMLRALEGRYKEKKAYISLEERMGCGIHMRNKLQYHSPYVLLMKYRLFSLCNVLLM